MSRLAHVPLALAVQLIGWWLIGVDNWRALWVCGLAGIFTGFFREVTQEEYRYIETHGGLRANMPALAGFNLANWNRHSIDETAVSALAVLIVAIVIQLIRFGGF